MIRLRKPQQAPGAPPGGAILNGCLFAVGAALVTCFLLLLNGIVVSAMCAGFADSEAIILTNPQVIQFVLFVGPVLLVILEWMMIDALVHRLRRRT